jgi:hypothetical protein
MRPHMMLLNTSRAHLPEFGLVTAQGPARVLDLMARLEKVSRSGSRT